MAPPRRPPRAPVAARAGRPRLDALIDAIVHADAGGAGQRRVRARAPAADAPRRQQAVLRRRPGHRDRRLGAARAPDHRYSELQAGVQLASRSGALNEIEYSEFVQKVAGASPKPSARCPTCPTCWRSSAARASSTP
ncbi:MAG: hypothetical protein MZW92_55935 [Comamonadaceae bacterium]|nr:hypothetical protein [Comamonadaceae bacterium]